jgi:hypothetical protein
MDTRPDTAAKQQADQASHRRRAHLMVAALLVACVGIGAALGAGTHPASSLDFRAESELTVSASASTLQPVAWHTLGQALMLPSLRAEIAHLTGEEASALRIGTLGDPQSSLITVYADGGSPSQADSLANTAVSVAVNFLRNTVDASAITRSTFEDSTDGWDVGTGIFVVPPSQIQQTHLVAHGGSASLAVTCLTAGCGPYLLLNRTFRQATSYTAVGWVKAQPSTRIRIVLGSTPQDVAVGATISGGPGWKRLSVEWTPQHSAPQATTTFQVMSRGSSRFDIDDVEVGPRAAIQSGAARQINAGAYRTILPAAASSTLESGDTAIWAATGAGAGFLVGAAAAATGIAATRRRRRIRAADQETLF